MTVEAYAAHKAGEKLEPFEYELGSLKPRSRLLVKNAYIFSFSFDTRTAVHSR